MSRSGLATVMFTDLVDSTLQRTELGDDVADDMVGEHDHIITVAATANDGRVVKTLGDGALLVFPSALAAVSAATVIQDAIADYNIEASAGREMSVRIGVHAGEVVTVDEDLSGLPVAIASRVCGVAEGGQILVTSVVRSLIGRRGDVQLRSIGMRALKGVPDPEEIWLVVDEAAPEPETTTRSDIAFPSFLARGVPAALVGRRDALAQLDSAYEESTKGGARLVAVIGEPGIGKTALTSTWTNTAHERGIVVVGGRCTPDAALPYQPFIEIARAILKANPSKLADVGSAAGNIARVVPGINAPGILPPPVQGDPDTIQYLMAEAFISLLRAEQGQPATVAVIDDIHWADEPSIAVLAHIARYEGDLSLLVIGTYRDTDLARSHPLPRLLADLRRSRTVERIPLDTLTTAEVAEMISTRIGEAISDDVAESISVETKGNPFFITEMTAHLRDEGAIDDQGRWVSDIPIGEYGIPEGVRDVVGRRLERLGDDAMDLLQVAAVIGPSFSIDVAGATAGLDAETIDDVFDAGLESGVLLEGDTPNEAAFSHALIRQTLYDDLPVRRRVRLHKAVAEALEEAGAPPAEVLPHWLTANISDRAIVAAIDAAYSARMASSEREAMRHFELAVELWDEVNDPETLTGTTKARIVYQLAILYGDFAIEQVKAQELVDEQIVSGVPDPVMLALLHSTKSNHLWQAGDIGAAMEQENIALSLVENEPPSPERAEVLAMHAGRLMTNGRHHEAIAAGEAAMDDLESVSSTRAETTVATALGTSYGSIGDLASSGRWFDRLNELAKETGSVRAHLVRFMNQGEVFRNNGLYAEASESFNRGISESRDLGVERWTAALLGNRADIEMLTGRWDDAIGLLDEAPDHPALDFPELTIIGKRMLIAAERGNDEVFDTTAARLDGYDIANQEPQVNAAIWVATISRLRWRGDLQAAYDLASVALDNHKDIDPWSETAPLASLALEVVADAETEKLATASWIGRARGWNEQLQRSDVPSAHLSVYQALAAAYLASAEGTNDPGLWRTAIDESPTRPYLRARAQVRLAMALQPGDPRSVRLLDDARHVAVDLGAQPLLTMIGSVAAFPAPA
jgi:class 3 adenylate cyclase/tetratricopeptide (TPR) repeat protein